MAIIGPGSQVNETEAPKSMLDGASQYEYVTILNPLSDDFQIMVAQDIPVNVPFEIRKDNSGKTSFITTDESGARLNYGLNLKNPDYQAHRHIHNMAIIPAGQTMNFSGNEAQTALRQLVNELLQREGKRRFLADPFVRREAEMRIVKGRGNIQDLMDMNMQTPQAQAQAAIKKSNEAQNDPFPGLRQTTEPNEQGSQGVGSDNPAQQKRVGRPPKATQPVNN